MYRKKTQYIYIYIYRVRYYLSMHWGSWNIPTVDKGDYCTERFQTKSLPR